MPRWIFAFLLIQLLAVSAFAQIDVNAQWGVLGRDPRHTSRAPYLGPKTMPQILWKRRLMQPPISCVTIDAQGNVYAAGQEGQVAVLSPNGEPLWNKEMRASMFAPITHGANQKIYLNSFTTLFCMTPDGEQQWSYINRLAKFSAPMNIAPNGNIYLTDFNGGLAAIKPDGELAWRFQTVTNVYASCAIGADSAAYVADLNQLYAVNANGSERWRFPLNGLILTPPSLGVDGTVYLLSTDSFLYAVSSSGQLRWKTNVGGAKAKNIAIGGDQSLYMAFDNKVVCVSAQGGVRWSAPLTGNVLGSIALDAAGDVYLATDARLVYGINSNGAINWELPVQYPVTQSGVVLDSNGRLYLVDNEAYLHQIGKPANSRVSGSLQLEDYVGAMEGLSAEIELRYPQSNQIAFQTVVPLDTDGNYLFDAPLSGQFRLFVKVSHWLSQSALITLQNSVSGINFELLNGDADRNDLIDDFDLAQIIFNFNQNNSTVDLNGNGLVDDFDLAPVIFNFGFIGDRRGF